MPEWSRVRRGWCRSDPKHIRGVHVRDRRRELQQLRVELGLQYAYEEQQNHRARDITLSRFGHLVTRRRARAEEGDALELSFVDVICCGMGATIILVIVFFAMPHFGELGMGARSAGAQPGSNAPILVTVSGLNGELVAGSDDFELKRIGADFSYTLVSGSIPTSGIEFRLRPDSESPTTDQQVEGVELLSNREIALLTERAVRSYLDQRGRDWMQEHIVGSSAQPRLYLFGEGMGGYWSVSLHEDGRSILFDIVHYTSIKPTVVNIYTCPISSQIAMSEAEISPHFDPIGPWWFDIFVADDDPRPWVQIRRASAHIRIPSPDLTLLLGPCHLEEYELPGPLGLDIEQPTDALHVLNSDLGPRLIVVVRSSEIEVWRLDEHRTVGPNIGLVSMAHFEPRCAQDLTVGRVLIDVLEGARVDWTFSCWQRGQSFVASAGSFELQDLLGRSASQATEVKVQVLAGSSEAIHLLTGPTVASATPVFTLFPSGVVEPGTGWTSWD